jgi:ribosomal protein S18 acetylase RimI-like enzyme
MSSQLSARPVRQPDDGDFLLALYSSTRRPELVGLGWSEAEEDAFVRMQFDAQRRQYRGSFPDAQYSVICLDGEPAGRLIVNRSDTEILIVDIAILPQFRRAGIGRQIVRGLMDEADASRLPMRCHVLRGNHARHFWEQYGFVVQDGGGVYVAMERGFEIRPP